MARTPTNHEQRKTQIVDAATAVFAELGYNGATNKLIAERVGALYEPDGKAINPALIYHYFPEGKPALFRACLEQVAPLRSLEGVIDANFDQPPRQFFTTLLHAYARAMGERNVMRVIQLKVVEASRHPEISQPATALTFPAIQKVVAYILREQANGTIKPRSLQPLLLQLFAPVAIRELMNAQAAARTDEKSLLTTAPGADDELIANLVEDILLPGR